MQPAEHQEQPLDADAIVALLLDYAEAAIHQLLHQRQVYPKETFERAKKYELPVWTSRFPEINEYICKSLGELRPAIVAGSLTAFQVALVHLDHADDEAVIETHQFLLSTFTTPNVSRSRWTRHALCDALRGQLARVCTINASIPLPSVLADNTVNASFRIQSLHTGPLSASFPLNRDEWLSSPAPPNVPQRLVQTVSSVHTGLVGLRLVTYT